MTESEALRVLSTLGLCKKAGRLLSGTPACCDAMRAGKLCAVIYAQTAAENSKKRICDKAKTYSVPAFSLPVTPEALAKSVGKAGAVAAVGITDEGFAGALRKYWDN
ncbi:MAG: ribosomal L7Ae/L30e/S12e/Gadd45 family protein [Clostridia bacterium]|nr:ribosomal L7Ae/L30e/S12e/Gadd45 family protein [Clostridia bacterium]